MKVFLLLLFLLQTLFAQKLIDFNVTDLKSYYLNEKYHLAFKIIQKPDNIQSFDLPLQILCEDETIDLTLEVTKNEAFEITLDSQIFKVTFDKAQTLKRLLTKSEQKTENNTSLELIYPTPDKGIIFEIAQRQQAIEVPKNLQFTDIIEKIEDKKVIFAGESHDKFSHHLGQLRIIKALHDKGKKVAIGMEMFQRKFQHVLDDYLQGKITLKTFLKKSEYFQRWGFEYNLYKPIINYAKKQHIPIVALNLERELTKKIAKSGLTSLSKNELSMLPQTIDFSNHRYKKALLDFFASHTHMRQSKKQNLTYLYQSQILWDQTMAESINKYLDQNSDHQIVVLVGSGHLKMHHGIPDRVKYPYSIILQDEDAKPKSADFILYSDEIETKEAIKLGVGLAFDKLLVTQVTEGSIASKLGLQKGDLLLSLDEELIKTLADLKLLLYFKASTDKLVLTVERAGKKITKTIEIP